MLSVHGGTRQTSLHHVSRELRIPHRTLIDAHRRALPLHRQEFIEGTIAENEVAHRVRAEIGELAQVVLVIPVDHSLRQTELRIEARHGASENPAGR